MDNKGQIGFVLILILVIAALVFIYPLGGGKKTDELINKWQKLKCPEIPTNMTCELGVDLYQDANGCTQAKCKQKDEPDYVVDATALKVFFVDVGEGDAIYIRTPDNKHVVIDAGRDSKMADFLSLKGIKKVDWIIATHPDIDHIGGVDEIFDKMPVNNYVTSPLNCTVTDCGNVGDYVPVQEGVRLWKASTGFDFTGLSSREFKLEVLSPNIDIPFRTLDDNAIVLKLTYKGTSFLFTSDCKKDCEDMLLLLDRNVKANILKVSDGGDREGTSAEFLVKVSPAYSIFSYGDTNILGHPSKLVLDRFILANIKEVRTASAGTIEVRTDGTRVEWYCEKKTDCFT